ncbi:hypothetical protein CcaverHIS002_0111090 [Cutaneotrichosporon cavernicola]|nr:hypothetical protein CcaverHIS002_0111090 [Cutaneotrichosporon cavernicola]
MTTWIQCPGDVYGMNRGHKCSPFKLPDGRVICQSLTTPDLNGANRGAYCVPTAYTDGISYRVVCRYCQLQC